MPLDVTKGIEQSSIGNLNSARLDTIIVGLGNPILGDDGIGWRIAEEVNYKLKNLPDNINWLPFQNGIDVVCISSGGLSLMEQLIGYRNAVIIDAIDNHQHPVGFVSCFPLEEIEEPFTGHTSAIHDTSLKTAIALGKTLGAKLPDNIMIVAVQASIEYIFSERLSEAVEEAIDSAIELVFGILQRWSGNSKAE